MLKTMAAATTPGPVLQQDLENKFDQLTALLENFSSSPGPGDAAIKELVDLKTKEKDQQIQRLKKDQIAVNRQATQLATKDQKKYDELKRKLDRYKTKTKITLKFLADSRIQNKKKIKDKEKEIKGRKGAQKAMASLFKQRIDKFTADIKKLKSELKTAKDHALVTFDDNWKQSVNKSKTFPEAKALKEEAEKAKKVATKAKKDAENAEKQASERMKTLAIAEIEENQQALAMLNKDTIIKNRHVTSLKLAKQLLEEAEEEYVQKESKLKEINEEIETLQDKRETIVTNLKQSQKAGIKQAAAILLHKVKMINRKISQLKGQKKRLVDVNKIKKLRQETKLFEKYGETLTTEEKELVSEMEDFLKEIGEIKDEKKETPKKVDTNPSTTTSILGGLKTGAKAVGAAGVLGAGAYGLTKMFGTPAQQKKADEIKDTIVSKISKATDPVTRTFSSNPPPVQSILKEPRIHNECAY